MASNRSWGETITSEHDETSNAKKVLLVSASGSTATSTGSTGSTVPSAATYIGIRSVTSGNLAGLSSPSTTLNSTMNAGEGIATAMVAQFDDVSPTTITENNFGNVRMTAARALMTEQVYAYSRAIADTQVKATAGFVHTVTIAPTGTPVTGVITIYDSVSETGTAIFSMQVPATVFSPVTVRLDVNTSTGIYIGFDASVTNTQVTVSYR